MRDWERDDDWQAAVRQAYRELVYEGMARGGAPSKHDRGDLPARLLAMHREARRQRPDPAPPNLHDLLLYRRGELAPEATAATEAWLANPDEWPAQWADSQLIRALADQRPTPTPTPMPSHELGVQARYCFAPDLSALGLHSSERTPGSLLTGAVPVMFDSVRLDSPTPQSWTMPTGMILRTQAIGDKLIVRVGGPVPEFDGARLTAALTGPEAQEPTVATIHLEANSEEAITGGAVLGHFEALRREHGDEAELAVLLQEEPELPRLF